MFLSKVLHKPNLVGVIMITLLFGAGFIYAFAFDGFNIEKVTGSEVEAWLAATGGSGSGGDDTPEDGGDTPGDGGDTPGDGSDTPDDGGETPDDGSDTPDDGFDWANIDFTDTSNWPTPPSGGDFGVSGDFTEGTASKEPYKGRGEKSLYDDQGGEWRPSKVNVVHHVEDRHWDHKPYDWNENQQQNIGEWMNIDFDGNRIPDPE